MAKTTFYINCISQLIKNYMKYKAVTLNSMASTHWVLLKVIIYM